MVDRERIEVMAVPLGGLRAACGSYLVVPVHRALFAIVVAITVVLAACGGSTNAGPSKSTTTTSQTNVERLTQRLRNFNSALDDRSYGDRSSKVGQIGLAAKALADGYLFFPSFGALREGALEVSFAADDLSRCLGRSGYCGSEEARYSIALDVMHRLLQRSAEP